MPGPDWLWYMLAALGVLGGAATAAWALLADRSRGTRRCPRCWYELAGAPGLVCPECGHDARHERRLHRTRRRWGWAAVGSVLALAGVACGLAPRVRREGAWSVVPVSAVLAAEWIIGRGAWPALSARRNDLLWTPTWDWQFRILVARRLHDLHTFREAWPAGRPIHVANPDWFFARRKEGVAYRFERWSPGRAGAPPRTSHERFAVFPSGEIVGSEHDRAIAVEVRSVRDDGGPGREFEAFRLVFPVRRVATVDEAIEPLRDARADEAVRATLEPRLVVYAESGRAGIALREPTFAAGAGRVAVGLVITVEREGEVIARARALTRLVGIVGDMLPPVELEGDLAAVLAARADDPAWTVRIRGDGETALRDFEAGRYWAGELVFPLGEVKK